MFTIATHSDAPHARAARSFDTSNGIFHDNAAVG